MKVFGKLCWANVMGFYGILGFLLRVFSLLYNGYRVFPGVRGGRGVLLTTHTLLVPRSWKSRAIPLPTLCATPGL